MSRVENLLAATLQLTPHERREFQTKLSEMQEAIDEVNRERNARGEN